MTEPTRLTGSTAIYQAPKGPQTLGEGPIYRSSDSTLHWFDCLSTPSELYILKTDPETGLPLGPAKNLPLEDSITFACFRQNKPGSYIAAYYQGVCFLDEETGKFEVVKEIIPTSLREERRFNDGGVDAKGRFWLAEIDRKATAYGPGKMPPEYGVPKGRVWRYDPDGSLHLMMEEGLVCGNGLAWSPDNKTMYINDSLGMVVYAFDFDLESGSISNKRVLVDRRAEGGEPDGAVIDSEGNIWMAVYDTNRVMVFSPEAKLLKEITFPAKRVTCPTWGGKDHDIVYVVSGKDTSDDRAADDEGGHVFMYKAEGVRGRPKYEFAG